MPNTTQELERERTTGGVAQTTQPAPANEEANPNQEAPVPVQTDNPGDPATAGLMEDPALTGSGPSASPSSPSSGPAASPSSQTSGPAASPSSQTTPSSPSAPSGPATPPSSRTTPSSPSAPSGPATPPSSQTTPSSPSAPSSTTAPPSQTAPPTSQTTQSSDPYALLKKDVSSLSDPEKQERSNLLIKKYVEDYKKKKSKETDELTQGLTDDQKSKEETRRSVNVPGKSKSESRLETADKVFDIGDRVSDYTGAGVSLLTDTAGAVHNVHDKDDLGRTDIVGGSFNIATGAWSTASGIYGMARAGQQARQKRKKGDSRGAKLAGFDVASKLFGTVSGAASMGGGIAGVVGGGAKLGGSENKAADDASSALSYISNAAGMAGSLTDMFKGIYQTGSYRRLANRKKTGESRQKMEREYAASKNKYKDMKAAYDRDDSGARTKEKRMEMLQARHARKRSKDFIAAMESAQENARLKSKAGHWGIAQGALNTTSGLIGLAGSLAKQFGGTGGAIAGAVLGGLGSLLKIGTKEIGDRVAKKKEEGAQKKASDTSGKKYLDDKVAAFLRKPEPQADHVTDEEARLIIAKRLGVDDPTKYSEIYKKLAERRADRILNKEEGYQDVLAAMGLSESADKATILEAMGVS